MIEAAANRHTLKDRASCTAEITAVVAADEQRLFKLYISDIALCFFLALFLFEIGTIYFAFWASVLLKSSGPGARDSSDGVFCHLTWEIKKKKKKKTQTECTAFKLSENDAHNKSIGHRDYNGKKKKNQQHRQLQLLF